MDITQIFQSFKNEWADQGRRIDFDHVYQYQCVDLILQYVYEKFGLTNVRGNAIDYWNNPSPALLTKFVKVQTNQPLIGDIVIFSFNHIGISNGVVSDTSVQVIDENGGALHNGDGLGSDSIETHTYGRKYIVGVLRPAGAVYSSTTSPSNTIARIGQTINLSPTVSSWRVYRVGGPWTPGNEIAKLNPQQYGGLSYEVLSSPAANMYIIQTQMFGQVAIYAGQETPATFSDKVTLAPTPQAVPVAVPPNTEYTKLSSPLNLVTNKQPTHLWGLGFDVDANATSIEELALNTPFVAYGKAQRTDHDRPCYYMTEADFGNADTIGAPARNAGVNTVDLSPAPVASTVLAAETEAAVVPVRVEPADPDKWKQTFTAFLGPVDYLAKNNVVVTDLDGKHPNVQLVGPRGAFKGQKAVIAGQFEKDGQTYFRTRQSVASDVWYGIPEDALVKESDVRVDNFVDEAFKTAPQIKAILTKPSSKANVIKAFATIEGFFAKVTLRK